MQIYYNTLDNIAFVMEGGNRNYVKVILLMFDCQGEKTTPTGGKATGEGLVRRGGRGLDLRRNS